MNSPATELVRDEGISLHKQLFIVLRDEITRGTLAPGSTLPSQEALCEQFGVSRITVRRALADLESQGLVVRRQGFGTVVRDVVPAGLPEMNLSFLDSLERTAQETRVEVLSVGMESPPPQVRSLLQLESSADAMHTVRVRRGAGANVPLMLIDAWIPRAFAAGITKAALKSMPLYQILSKNGSRFGRIVQEISAEAANPMRATVLQVAVSAPLIRLTRLTHDVNDRPMQYLVAHASPERSRIVMELSSDEVDTLGAGHLTHVPKFLRAQTER